MMAGREPEAEKTGLDATILQLLYYGVYILLFGKMLLVIIEGVAG